MRAIYKLDNKTNIDYIFLRHNILKFKDIINISIYKYMFRIYNTIICIVQFVSYLPIIALYILLV